MGFISLHAWQNSPTSLMVEEGCLALGSVFQPVDHCLPVGDKLSDSFLFAQLSGGELCKPMSVNRHVDTVCCDDR